MCRRSTSIRPFLCNLANKRLRVSAVIASKCQLLELCGHFRRHAEQPNIVDITYPGFWDTRQDAEKYERDIYPQVSGKLEDAIEGKPMVCSFEVNNSTWYDIHA